MISIRCPHCQVGLKVDENKIPANIQTFKCPKCKSPIEVAFVLGNKPEDDSETLVLSGAKPATAGSLHVLPNDLTPEQNILLSEGVNIVGRKSAATPSPTAIETTDKLMSRAHIGVEVRKDEKGENIHYLYDNKSKNRTLYNSRYIEPGEVVVLKNGDEIQIGQTRLVFVSEKDC
ncbi:MAG: zinc-ribbon domain-containing protein [Dysgonamonadaceae bacterium]|jgi:predicted Zn finger-like uncharacterized protein|nr:zinc-ribbon domain-containing protein [Dysgonamonadaceae bacterium]